MSLAAEVPDVNHSVLYTPAGNQDTLAESIRLEQVDMEFGIRMVEAGLLGINKTHKAPPLRLDGVLGTMALGPAKGMPLWDINFYSRFGRMQSKRPLMQTIDVLEDSGYVTLVEPLAKRDDWETRYRLGELGLEFALPLQQLIDARRSWVRRSIGSIVSILKD